MRVAGKSGVVANSPVEFAIIGPVGRKRGVLLKSENAGLDLLGSQSFITSDREKSIRTLFPMSPDYHRVSAEHKVQIDEEDPRLGEFWFLWKGIASEENEKVVQDEFTRRLADIIDSKRLAVHVEWAVAPLVTICESYTKYYTERRNRRRWLLWIGLAMYLLLVILLWFLREYFRL